MLKSYTILNFVWETLWCSPLFAFEEHITAEKEIKMLKLKTLFMLVNAVLYEYGPSLAPKIGKASFKSIFEKIFKFSD